MNKGESIYSDSLPAVGGSRKRKKTSSERESRSSTPQWVVFAGIISMTFMLCVAINFRAFGEMNRQIFEHQQLNSEIKELRTGSVVLQEEIQKLKKDPKTIEKEARKIGMSRPNEKILVPMN